MEKTKIPINPLYQRFNYAELDQPRQIRLLRVSREEEAPDVIRCRFKHVLLDELSDSYIAISYFWGPDSPTHWARFPDNTYLEMPASSASVLQRVLAANKTEYIWIDALCINQRDLQEKPHQIRLMKDIYSRAQYVFAWLGDASDDSKEAMEFIPKIHHVIGYLHTSNQPITMESVTQFQHCGLHSPMWKALINLVERKWFQRVWIIQEIVLARRIELVCGDESVDWQTLAVVVSMLQSNGLSHLLIKTEVAAPFLSWGFKGVQCAWGIRALRGENTPISLETALFSCAFYEAKDARDKLFALLAMCSNVDDGEFHPCYTDQPEIVYERYARRLLTRPGASLDILHGGGTGFPRALSGLPSWVPDWSSHVPRTVFGQLAQAGYYASGKAPAIPRVGYNPDTRSITLKGRVIDEIKDLSRPMPEGMASTTWQGKQEQSTKMLAWYTDSTAIFASGATYPTNELFFPNVIARTLTASLTLQGNSPTDELLFATFQAWLTYSRLLSRGNPQEREYITRELAFAADQFTVSCSTAMGTRPLLVSEKLYLGLAPPGTLKGDVLAIILGAATPFILRRGSKGYVLVGECYVHGLMHGEGLDLGEEVDITLH